MQIDPVKPTLKAPGTKRLKLTREGLLSDFGFKFNLRRYILALRITAAREFLRDIFVSPETRDYYVAPRHGPADAPRNTAITIEYEVEGSVGKQTFTVGRCRLTLSNPR